MNFVLLMLILVNIIGTWVIAYYLNKALTSFKASLFPGQAPQDYEKILKDLQIDGGKK